MSLRIIDFHTHPFLLEKDNIARHKESNPLSSDEFTKILAKTAITHFAGSVICHRENGLDAMRESNEYALTLKKIYVNKYIPGIMVDARYVDESIKEIDKARSEGVRLIGELVPSAMGWSFKDESFRNILDHTKGSDFIYSFHSTDDVAMLESIARDYPDTPFVFAHPGEQKRLDMHIEAMKRCENIYLDLSGTGLFRFGMLKNLVSKVGAKRIIFGTDFPICNPAMYVAGVLFENISEMEMDMIFYENAKWLLKI